MLPSGLLGIVGAWAGINREQGTPLQITSRGLGHHTDVNRLSWQVDCHPRKTRSMSLHENPDAAAREWAILQPLYEHYERPALIIKLLAVALFGVGVAIDMQAHWLILLCLVMWMQEGIFKTYQARLGARLLRLEQWLAGDPAAATLQVFHLHRDWAAQRGGSLGLMLEYLRSASRPTVAFPYALLVLAAVVEHGLQ